MTAKTSIGTTISTSVTDGVNSSPLKKGIGSGKRYGDGFVPLVGGMCGGAVSTVLLYPLDFIKVRMQADEGQQRRRQASLRPVTQESAVTKRKTIARTLGSVLKHEGGVVGLYQGLTPALIGSAASWGGYFFLYEGIKARLLQRKQQTTTTADNTTEVKMGPAENFTSACMSGAVMVLLTNPIWLIKTRMQLQRKLNHDASLLLGNDAKESMKAPYRNMLDAARTILKEEGVLALYKGAIPALLLVSHGGVQFVSYEFLKDYHFGGAYTRSIGRTSRNHHDSSVMTRLHDSLGYLTIGAISKIIASTTTYPLQVIKTRLQQRSSHSMLDVSESGQLQIVKQQEYKGVLDCTVKIWQREGVTGFFKGCVPNAIRVAPSAAVTFVVYESIMDFLG